MHLPHNNSGSLQPTKSRYERLSWYNWDANQQVFNRDLPKTVSITCCGQEIMMLALTSGRAPDFVLHCRLLNNDVEWESNPYHRTTCGSITRQRKNNWQYFDRPWAKPAPEPKPSLSTKPQQHVRISHPERKKPIGPRSQNLRNIFVSMVHLLVDLCAQKCALWFLRKHPH